MGKSFFLGTDAELYVESEVFATKIAATPAVYGLTALLATSYGTLNATWRAAYEAALDPSTRTQAKVAAKNDAADAVRAMASDLAKIVDGTATVTNEQKLDLGLSVRAARSPKPAPGMPGNLKLTLNGDGSLELKWKCPSPPGATGTMYKVSRRIASPDGSGGGDFSFLAVVGTRKFIDSTIPAGSTQMTYQIQAVRSTLAGPSAQFNVNFGMSSSGGTMGTSVVQAATPAAGPKIAA